MIWNISGFKFIFEKIYPPKEDNEKRKASTFMIWFISIYIGAFSISSGIYENRRDLLETQVTFLVTQFSMRDHSRKAAIARISKIQNSKIPVKPIFISLNSFRDFYTSLFSPFYSLVHSQIDTVIVNQLKELIENEKYDLSGINLEKINLESSPLHMAMFKNAILNQYLRQLLIKYE